MNCAGLRIKCPNPNCKTTEFDETTEQFDPNESPRGDMVRRQSKWRKLGMTKGFNRSSKHYEITCGKCDGSLVPKSKQFILADPLPVEAVPEPETVTVDSLTSPVVEDRQDGGQSDPPKEAIPEVIPSVPLDILEDIPIVQVENHDGTAIVTSAREIPVIDNGPSPEMVAQYREFKTDHPEASWREAWQSVPNDYPDSKNFTYHMRKALKEAGE